MVHSKILVIPFKLTLVCVLIAADVFLFTFLLTSLQKTNGVLYAKESKTTTKNDSASVAPFGESIQHTAQTIQNTSGNIAKNIAAGISTTAQNISNTAGNIAQNVATSVTRPVTIIRPEPTYDIPQIKSDTQPVTTVKQNQQQPSPTAASIPPAPASGVWPVRGIVTTEFGAYHQPFQDHHTGIDIASGLPIGTASITPFKEGTVLETIRSPYGLGNHIIIDHGGGITAYYCHLSSITVAPGQPVKPGDILGYEGRTGTATGPHLHLEIRENGIPVNPRKYLAN